MISFGQKQTKHLQQFKKRKKCNHLVTKQLKMEEDLIFCIENGRQH